MISFTLLENADGPLTKRFKLGDDDQLDKKTAGKLYRGTAKRVSVGSLAEFAALHGTLECTQALTYGITDKAEAAIVSQDELQQHPGAIARDRAHFRYSQQPAILFLDYDYDPSIASGPPLTAEEVRAKLIDACPALAEAPMLAVASASTFIYQGDKQLKGPGGWHLYVAVQNGADIPRAGAALGQHLWRIGTGHYIVSKSGALLSRCLIDSSVFQPESIDFAAGAIYLPPLEQRRPEPQLWNPDAPLFDSRRIAEPTAEELEGIKQKQLEARELVDGARQEVREAYIAERVADLIDRGVPKETAQRTAEYATDQNALLADFVLQRPDGKEVTVGDLLKDPSKYHGQRFRDPLEPDYRGDFRIAQANLFSGGRPYLWSHAHGGRRFELFPQTRVLQIQPGELPRRQDDVLEVLRLQGNVFDQPIGNAEHRMVYVANGYIVPFTEVSLQTYLGRLFRFEKYDGRSKCCVPTDTPLALVRGIMGESTSRKLPALEGVVSDPVMRADGSILKTAGYFERDRLLPVYDSLLMPIIPDNPTSDQLRGAFDVLWRPFELFPFVDEKSRGAMLAALLTATVRAAIGTAPAFMFEAPSAGTGKSLLAKCVASLATARRAVPESPPTDVAEQKKSLFAAVRGGSRLILWDNWTQPVYGSSALCAFVTSPRYGDRVLGVSQKEEYPNRALVLFTGNNPGIEGDACRRVVRVRIDANTEKPALRSFDLEPESHVLDHRAELWAAALTLLRGYQAAGAPKQTKDRAGSFEQWDALVRQCVVWIERERLAGVKLGDPYASAIENVDVDPPRDVIGSLLHEIRAMCGTEWKKPSEALNALLFTDMGRQAIEAIDAKGLTAIRFAHWLGKHTDQWVGALRLERRRNSDTKNWEYRAFEREPAAKEIPAWVADLL